MKGKRDTSAGPDEMTGRYTVARHRKMKAKRTSRAALKLWRALRRTGTQCRQAGTHLHVDITQWMRRHTRLRLRLRLRLRRRLRWYALVMVSRHRVVEFPMLGPVNLNGARLWLLCLVLTLGAIVHVS